MVVVSQNPASRSWGVFEGVGGALFSNGNFTLRGDYRQIVVDRVCNEATPFKAKIDCGAGSNGVD